MSLKIAFVAFVALSLSHAEQSPMFGVQEVFQQIHREPPLPEGTPMLVSDAIEELWVTQPLDHFDPNNHQTWQMRMFCRKDYYKPGGSVMGFIGGEWEISQAWLTTGHFHDIAREVGAFLCYTEHRYYGESRPVNDTSTANLKYLSIDQAIMDFLAVCEGWKEEFGWYTPIIVAGASYAGTIAAYLRQHYPFHVNGAWVSCGPLEAKPSFPQYKEIVGLAFRDAGGDECYEVQEEAFKELVRLVEAGESEWITREFGLCYPLDTSNSLDVTNFYYGIQNIFSGQVQSARPGSLKSICDYLNHPYWQGQEILGLAGFIKALYGGSCYHHVFANDTRFGQATEWEHPANSGGYRTWLWQTCTEFGWYHTTDSPNQPYGSTVPLSFSIEICKELFGKSYNKYFVDWSTRRINRKYKGKGLTASNVCYSHGSRDPWIGAGKTESDKPWAPVYIIPGEPHTTELWSISSSDSPEMRKAKEDIRRDILHWI